MTFLVDGTNGGTFPSWTTATRPASPAVGQMGYNTTTGQFDAYTSNGWVSVATSATAPVSGPAFSAYLAGSQTMPVASATKLIFDTEEYDTNNNFASSRFTPTVAGYYQLNWSIYIPTGSTNQNLQIWKNGSLYKMTNYQPGSTQWFMFPGNCLVYFNGSTDYVELYMGMQSGGVVGNNAGGIYNWFQGYLARPA